MAPVIRISDDLYEKLSRLALGFDTPAHVIERLVAEHTGEPMAKAPTVSHTNKITAEIIEQIGLRARDVYEGKSSAMDAEEKLVTATNMHPGSARDYIANFQKMMAGEVYQRTMNGPATEHYLQSVLTHDGKAKLKTALASVRAHIDYYESFGKGKLQNIRKICDKFAKAV